MARLVAEGLSNPAIASALFISVPTVKTHVSHILAKLGLESRVQLASWPRATTWARPRGPPVAARLTQISPASASWPMASRPHAHDRDRNRYRSCAEESR